MFLGLNILGSLVLDINGDRLDATFLNSTGGASDTFTMIKQAGTPPVADFTAAPRAGMAPLTVSFTDASTTNTAAWAWDFDAGGTTDSTAQSPSTVYSQPGLYSVRLTASNQGGSDVETKTGYVCVAAQKPGPVSGLALTTAGGVIRWSAAAGATSYDLVKGSLGTLAATRGDFGASVLSCLVNDGGATSAADPAVPAVGKGFFYLVRSVGACALTGSYDEGGSQSAPRDPGIASAPLACP